MDRAEKVARALARCGETRGELESLRGKVREVLAWLDESSAQAAALKDSLPFGTDWCAMHAAGKAYGEAARRLRELLGEGG